MEFQQLKDIFNEKGIGIIGTSDKHGWVNMAIYSPPIITPDNILVFAATQRLTYKNLTENPKAMFMYICSERPWKGVRISLSLVKDETSGYMLKLLKKRFESMGYLELASEICHALYFKIEEIRALKG